MDGTGFVNYQDVLNLNRPQAQNIFDRLYNGLDQQGQQAQQGISQATGAFNQAADSAFQPIQTQGQNLAGVPSVATPDPSRAGFGLPGSKVSAFRNPVAQSSMTGLGGGQSSALTMKASSANPYAQDAGFTTNADGSLSAPTYNYQAPTLDLTQARQGVGQFNQNLTSAQSPGGVGAYYQNQNAGSGYSSGMGAFDEALAQGTGKDSRLAQLQAKYGGIFGDLENAQTDAGNTVQGYKDRTQGYQAQADQYAGAYNQAQAQEKERVAAAEAQHAQEQAEKDAAQAESDRWYEDPMHRGRGVFDAWRKNPFGLAPIFRPKF